MAALKTQELEHFDRRKQLLFMVIFFIIQTITAQYVSSTVMRIHVSWSHSRMAVGSTLSGRVSLFVLECRIVTC